MQCRLFVFNLYMHECIVLVHECIVLSRFLVLHSFQFSHVAYKLLCIMLVYLPVTIDM